jgi:hypothetical protein
MNHDFFENSMSNIQHDTPNSLVPLATTAQHPFSCMLGPNMELSSCDVGLSFQGGREWNIEPQINGADDPLPSLPSYESSNNASHVSNTSPAKRRPSSSSSHELDNMGSTAAVERPSKQRRIMPKPMKTASEAIEGVGAKPAKRAGRRGPLPEKRKQKVNRVRDSTACAACFASHVEVSCHCCDCCNY